MYGTKEMKQDLQVKLDVGARRLQQLVQQRAAELPSTREEALFVLAHENGLKLSRYLTAEQIAAVRGLVQNRPASGVVPAARTNGARAQKKSPPRPVAVTIANVDVGEIPGLKASH